MVAVTVAGLVDVREGASADLRLSPNPTAGLLYWDGEAAALGREARVSVTTAAGQVVLSQSASPTLDLSGFPAGVYLVTLRKAGGMGTWRGGAGVSGGAWLVGPRRFALSV